ncbi:cystathionine beta-synthase, putative [Eimeria praecox]|uniref:cystathionine beta-synthase n=1 Tax=Eimeria praecox TaxID=51316 RepID=U6H507_9EIME|nr:cystathionine beta-synthase, putative [Eimeria praecox]
MDPRNCKGVIITGSRILGPLAKKFLHQEDDLQQVIETIQQENKDVIIPSYETFQRQGWDGLFSLGVTINGDMGGSHGCRNGNEGGGHTNSEATATGLKNLPLSVEDIERIFSPPPAFFQGHLSRELPSILDAIGCTPLVRLSRVARALGISCQLLGKCEFLSAGGSTKDRIARGMILAAEAAGRLAPGAALIEPTSGNTGIGLAMVSAVKGYRSVAVMPMKMSAEKHRIMRALGSTILRTPTSAAWDDQNSHIALSLRLEAALQAQQRALSNSIDMKCGMARRRNISAAQMEEARICQHQIACILDQYRNPANPLSHFFGTGAELLAQSGGKLDMVVICAGTGGSLTGIGRRIKAEMPHCIVVGVDPEGSVLANPDEKAGKPYAVEGIGYDFVPTVLDRETADCWVKTTDAESLLCSRLLLRTEGLLVGGSAGAALAGAVKAIEHFGWTDDSTKRVAFLLPDSSRNYTSKFVSDEWMVSKGFLDSSVLERQYREYEQQSLDSLNLLPLSFISSTASLEEATVALVQSEQSFLVVVRPEAAAEAQERGGVAADALVGVLTEQTLLKALGDFPSSAEVSNVVETEIPVFTSGNTSLARIAQTLELHPLVLIQSNTGVINAAVEPKKLLQAFVDMRRNRGNAAA